MIGNLLKSQERHCLCIFYFVGKKIMCLVIILSRQNLSVIISVNDTPMITTNMVAKMDSYISSYLVQRNILKVKSSILNQKQLDSERL